MVVLYHDDRLEHRLNMFGTVETSYYDELKLAELRDQGLGSFNGIGFPTLAEVLKRLRDDRTLVHVDVKTPGISKEILDAFREADMLDHIIGYGAANCEAFRAAAIPEIAFKGSTLGTHCDFDQGAGAKLLDRPGQVIFLDDPRAVLSQSARARDERS